VHKGRKNLAIAIAVLIACIMGTVMTASSSELDYMGLEKGTTWLYEITEFRIENGVRSEKSARLERRVVAVNEDTKGGITTYTIQDTLSDEDGIHRDEYLLSKTSAGVYYMEDGDHLHVVLEAPLHKSAKSRFSISTWSEQDVTFWGVVLRDTPFGQRDAWLGKDWIQYDDGSYVERTMELVPYIGLIYEGKLERLFPDGCS
jgi:hypothetical protein